MVQWWVLIVVGWGGFMLGWAITSCLAVGAYNKGHVDGMAEGFEEGFECGCCDMFKEAEDYGNDNGGRLNG